MSFFRRILRLASLKLASILSLLALIFAHGFLASCATTTPPTPVRPSWIADLDSDFVLDPLKGYPLAAVAEYELQVRQGFRALKSGAELGPVQSSLATLLEKDPGFHAAQLLRAQVAFIQGELEQSRDLLSPIADELPSYLPCQVLFCRVLEKLGDDWPMAHEICLRAGVASSAARQLADMLKPRAVDDLLQRAEDLLERGHLLDVSPLLDGLEPWMEGEDLRLLRLRRRLAAAEGDIEAEIVFLQQLQDSVDGGDMGGGIYGDRLVERLADLYLESGNVQDAIDMLEKLAVAHHEDPRWLDRLEQAKFRWRLQRLPDEVQIIASRAVLTRAELATLLYWLFPSIRFAEVSDPPIATDILDHERRREILQVIFLKLIPMDEALHRFWPDRSAQRSLALTALLSLLSNSEEELSCLSSVEARALARSVSLTCRKAAACGLISHESECLPQADISGPDARELLRRTLDLLDFR